MLPELLLSKDTTMTGCHEFVTQVLLMIDCKKALGYYGQNQSLEGVRTVQISLTECNALLVIAHFKNDTSNNKDNG